LQKLLNGSRKLLIGIGAIVLVIGIALGSILLTISRSAQTTTFIGGNNQNVLYELRFNESNPCDHPLFITPWSVSLLDKTSIIEPPNSNLSGNGVQATPDSNHSSIIFSVPNGSYVFSTNPRNAFFPQNGNVSVRGKDTTVMLQEQFASCGSATSTISSTTLTITEKVIEENVHWYNFCSVYQNSTTITSFILPENLPSEFDATVTTTIVSGYNSTTTLNPPQGVTATVNGTTVVTNCG